jgi:hypothetical protein
MVKRRFLASIALVLVLITAVSCSTAVPTGLDIVAKLVPVPEFTPQDVVGIQLAALKNNDINDRGIAVAYRFASPRNKSLTGNLENFASLLRSSSYAPMLGGGGFEVGPVVQEGNLAMVPAWVISAKGEGTGYVFILTRQDGGSHPNCWMTDGVLEFSDLDNGEYNLPEMPLTDST